MALNRPSESELESFMAAIRQKESGGNYTILNRDSGAYGAYQFMPETFRNAARQAGVSTSWPPSRAAQDAVARFLMSAYWTKTGGDWHRVATFWYAGPGSIDYSDAAMNKKQGLNGRYPSINEYGDSVMSTMTYIQQKKDPSFGRAGNAVVPGITNRNASTAEDAAQQGGFAGANYSTGRAADDGLGTSSGGPGTVGTYAATVAVENPVPLTNGGVLDLNDPEAVKSEVEARYGDLSDEEFLQRVYNDVLSREPDANGLSFWAGQLASGMSRDEIYRSFYASDEGGNTEPPLLSEVETMIRHTYPDWAWAMNNDEVREILLEAVDPTRGMDDATFQSKIRQTDWWKNTEATVRDWDARSAMDPATAQRQIEQEATRLARLATGLGSSMSQTQLTSLAEKVLRFGLTDTEINDALAEGFDAADPRGDVAANLRIARDLARDYLVTVPDSELIKWAQQIATGQANAEDLETKFATLAKAKFGQNKHLMELIDSGASPASYFAGHQQLIAQEMDLTSAQVDLMDPKYSPILSSAMDGSIRPMDLGETRSWVRQQSGWESTTTGRAKIASTTQGLLRAFGKVA